MAIKVNLKKVKLLDIEGNPIKGKAHQLVGKLIYAQSRNLDLVLPAVEIYKGRPVELAKKEIQQIKTMVENPEYGLLSFVRKAVGDYLEELLAKKVKDK